MDEPGNLEAEVEAFARQHRLLRPGHRVLVAVSGGRDSTVLLDLLHRLQERLGLAALGVAHVDHGLRPGSADDARWVAEQAAARGLPFLLRRVCVERGRRSLEDAARAARYRALREMAGEFGAHRVALAHHAGDQAETVLMRLVAGAGVRGLAGMRPRRGPFVRPLLAVTPARLAAYAAARGLTWRDDPTNRDLRILRNRVRHRLLPLLEAEFNLRTVETLARVATLLAAEADLLDRRTRRLEARLGTAVVPAVPVDGQAAGAGATTAGGGTVAAWACRVADLARLAVADQRRLLQAAFFRRAGRPLPWARCEAVRTLVRQAALGGTGGRVDLPGGWRARCDGAWLWLEPAEGAAGRPRRLRRQAPVGATRRGTSPAGATAPGEPGTCREEPAPLVLPVPGAVPLGCGLWLRARWLHGTAARQAAAALDEARTPSPVSPTRIPGRDDPRVGARFAFRALIGQRALDEAAAAEDCASVTGAGRDAAGGGAAPPRPGHPVGTGDGDGTGAAGRAAGETAGAPRPGTQWVLVVRPPRPGETLQALGSRGQRPVERLYRAAVRRGDLYVIDPRTGTGGVLPPRAVAVAADAGGGAGPGSGGAGRERILWLAGVRTAAACRVLPDEEAVLCLEVTARPPREPGGDAAAAGSAGGAACRRGHEEGDRRSGPARHP
ncbi:tRNA(Ile)-lysidine synthetase [Thermaerobacter marianensis DSM 12885]|uniref:tRNA(Ile)-lysidine synthase n=1 Tax=Thermaerobacter marianensis (strain ATCC 700841 / DSM 12885 / JCM 10246 / 7p75a) TaxID=644966 RepID=E6SL56_THEM7|nr:tRNA lysidine(34) synthetase TilS [Thermaerobacter marianensis]ADU50258.1 tRNA(Ile)-lysidine synthetase [Thermaerobacter marianensis DSM 12885]